MKVLLFSQYFWPESFRINEVAESLLKIGCEVTVLTGQPNYPQGKVFEGYRAFDAGRHTHPSGYPIYRVPLFPRGNGSGKKLILNYLSFIMSALSCGAWLLRKKHFDIVFVYGASPILQTLAALGLAKLKGKKVILWVQDLWPQSIEATGFIKNKIVLNCIGWLVSKIYQRCDLLLVQSTAFVPIVQAMANLTPVKYHPNPGELAFSQPLQKDRGAAVTLLPKFNIVFAGNFGKAQALPTILDAAELLLSEKDIQFVLVGSGSQTEWLSQEINRRNLHNVQLPGRFEPSEMPAILAQASALLVSLVKNPIISQTVPSKVQVYLAAGKPIIASLDGEGARVVAEAAAGIACPAENAMALASAIRSMHTMPASERLHMGENGIQYYKKNFDPNMLSLKLYDHFVETIRQPLGSIA